MTDFRVTWVIDLGAESPTLAAIEALAIQRDPDSTATVFDVQEVGPGAELVGGDRVYALGEKVRVDLTRLAHDVDADQEEFIYGQTRGVRPRA